MKKKLCSICNDEIYGFGNNPQPYIWKGKKLEASDSCCDYCNKTIVRKTRLLSNNLRSDLN